MSDKIRDELDRLEKAVHIVRAECSEWATPVIPVLKRNGQVRLCGNFKATVNLQLVIKRCAIHITSRSFMVAIDLTHAFMQFMVDEKSQDALMIITEYGLCKYVKLQEGVASNPTECQSILEDILRGVPHTEISIDNIFCTGKTDGENLEILYEIFSRLEKAGLRVNMDKCDLFKNEIEIFDYLLDETGFKPTRGGGVEVQKSPVPKDRSKLLSFLGLVMFYKKFLPDRANHLKPLYDLSKSIKCVWTDESTRAFEWIKNQITSDRVLVFYDPKLPLVLACDSSRKGFYRTGIRTNRNVLLRLRRN